MALFLQQNLNNLSITEVNIHPKHKVADFWNEIWEEIVCAKTFVNSKSFYNNFLTPCQTKQDTVIVKLSTSVNISREKKKGCYFIIHKKVMQTGYWLMLNNCLCILSGGSVALLLLWSFKNSCDSKCRMGHSKHLLSTNR